MPTDTIKSGENIIAAITAPPKAKEIGTPIANKRAIEPNKTSGVIFLPLHLP